ncbi:MAG: phosphatidate cytidylyltransferase [Candidatus Zixiibacteriota bacterium]|nr:MAG: phosphatidate cytidylyltransferase [candidate division Zixibacteria bacterium]
MYMKLTIIIGVLFVLGATIIAVTHKTRPRDRSAAKADWVKYVVMLAVVAAFLTAALAGRITTAFLLVAIALTGSYELYRNLPRKNRVTVPLIFPCSIVLIACLGHLLFERAYAWESSVIFVFLLVTAHDSFSQLWGKFLGRARLCPRLSPNKTVEGLVGGMITTAAVAVSLSFLMPMHSGLALVVFGLVISISSTAGDLSFSYIKRKLNIKDFSSLIPGHGGVLDRFDSLIAAAPAFYWTGRVLENHTLSESIRRML